MTPIYIDSSAVVRAVLERGLPRATARALATSSTLIVSRLALVETTRALHRARLEKRVSADALARAADEADDLWQRCEIWEVSRSVCEEAAAVAQDLALRTLDAIHIATFVVARKRLPTLRLLTTDVRMLAAATHVGLRTLKW